MGPLPCPGRGPSNYLDSQLKRWSWSVPDFLHRLAV
nr:MAG TPA: hypothetical protein [Caudoviricetes sp.]